MVWALGLFDDREGLLRELQRLEIVRAVAMELGEKQEVLSHQEVPLPQGPAPEREPSS